MAEAGDLPRGLQRRGEARRWRRCASPSCVGRFYEDLAKRLLQGADEGFELAGVPASSASPTSRSPAPTSCRWRRRLLIGSGEFAGDRLPRRRHPRRDRPLRLRLRRGGARDPGRAAGDRRALRLRRDHLRHDGAGAGACRGRQARPGPQRRAHRRPDGPAGGAARSRRERPSIGHDPASRHGPGFVTAAGKGPGFC